MPNLPMGGSQGELPLVPTVEVVADGIPMGVLNDGTGFVE